MERDAIINFALSQKGMSGKDYLKEISKVLQQNNVQYTAGEAWCSAFASYCYFKANCLNKVKFSASTQEMPRLNSSIWKEWPSSEGSEDKQLALLKSVNPADILIYRNVDNHSRGHAAIVTSIQYDDVSSISTYSIHTIDGNTGQRDNITGTRRVDERVVKYDSLIHGFQRGKNRILGFICPELTGQGILGIDINYTFTVRDTLLQDTILKLNNFNFNTDSYKNENIYQFSYYTKKYKEKIPGLNTAKYTNPVFDWLALPDMVAYCQGRAREVWDSSYAFDCGDETEFPTQEQMDQNPNLKQLFFNSTDHCLYQYSTTPHWDTESQTPAPPTTERWVEKYNLNTNKLADDFNPPFLTYKGNELLGPSPKELFKQAIKAQMNYQTAYNLNNPNNLDSYNRNSPQKNNSCTPRVGSIVVWSDGSAENYFKPGYCAFVERVRSDGLIFVSMSGRTKENFFESFWVNPQSFANGFDNRLNGTFHADINNRKTLNGVYLLGYIYPPDTVQLSESLYSFIQAGDGARVERVWII